MFKDKGIWNKTKEVTDGIWDGAKNVTEDVWESTKEVAGSVKGAFSEDKEAQKPEKSANKTEKHHCHRS